MNLAKGKGVQGEVWRKPDTSLESSQHGVAQDTILPALPGNNTCEILSTRKAQPSLGEHVSISGWSCRQLVLM